MVMFNRNVYDLTHILIMFTRNCELWICTFMLGFHFWGIIGIYLDYYVTCKSAEVRIWEREEGNMISRKLSWTQMTAIAISVRVITDLDGSFETGEACHAAHAAMQHCVDRASSYHYHLISIQVVQWRLFRSGQSSSGHGGSRTRPEKIIWTIDPEQF